MYVCTSWVYLLMCVDCFLTAFDLNMHVRPPKQLWLQQSCLHWPRPRPGKPGLPKNTIRYCFPMLSNWFSKVKTIHNIVTVLGISKNRCTYRTQNRFVPIAACRLPLTAYCLLLVACILAFIAAVFFFSIFFSLLVVVFVVVTVLFNYNYLFNHNFVRVSTIINHQMHHADSGRQNSVTGPTVSLTDWPLSARAANRKPEKEMEHGAWSCSAWSGHVECASCPSRSRCRSLSLSYCCSSCLAQKSSVSSSRTPQLSSQQSVSQSARWTRNRHSSCSCSCSCGRMSRCRR